MNKVSDVVVKVYRQFVSFPQLQRAVISTLVGSDILSIFSTWQQVDLNRKDKISFSKSYIIKRSEVENYEVLSRIPPQDSTNELWNVKSPSGRRMAVVRSVRDKSGVEQQYLEIWSDSNKIHSLGVEKIKAHDNIYGNDGQFGSVQWSMSEGHLLYIAERKAVKSQSYFERKYHDVDNSQEKTDEEIVKGDVNVLKESWGEQMEKKLNPVLCILDVDTCHISVLENVPCGVSAAQAVWGPDDSGVVFIGWKGVPYKLGAIACDQRPCDLYFLHLETGSCEKLVNCDDWSPSSPVFNSDRTKLVFLATPTLGPHRNCSRLHLYDWQTKQNIILVDVKPWADLGSDDFTGIFTSSIIEKCWVHNDRCILLNTQSRTRNEVILVNIETTEILTISENNDGENSIGSWSVLDVSCNNVLVACSSPNQPPFLMIGYLSPWNVLESRHMSGDNVVKWKRLDTEVQRWGPSKRSVIVNSSPTYINDQFESVTFDSVVYWPNNYNESSRPPLIVTPHGGPHGACVESFNFKSAFCQLGFAVLQTNYRGSTGYGMNSILSLPGRIGEQDIHDVQDSVDKLLPLIDVNNIFLFGGSHGGFITAHLIGQFPNFYRAAVCDNAVTFLPSLVATSDIPDWAYTEAGLPFDYTNVANSDTLNVMAEKSPMKYVDEIKTPVLFLLGQKDLRVPPHQGLYMAKALRARDVPVRILYYEEESHPLGSADAFSDVFVNILMWFSNHSSQVQELLSRDI